MFHANAGGPGVQPHSQSILEAANECGMVQLLESVHKVTSFLFFCRVQYFFCDGLVTTPSGGSCEISPCPHYHQHHHHYVKVTRNICLLDLKKDFKTRQKNINVSEFR